MTDPKLTRPLGIFLGILIVVMGILSSISLIESVIAEFAFQPTPSPVSVTPTYTSTVTYTPTNTPTGTPTPIPTGTPSPTPYKLSSTPTSTPSLADIPEPTPTATPRPKPDAVVKTEALNLRSGPGTVYDVVGWLKQGDFLEVIGRNLAGDWLKVITLDGREGWVAASLLEINLPLAGVDVAQTPPTPTPVYTPTPTVTPTPELLPPPILLEPENGASFAGWVTFKWQWDYPLKADEYFAFRVHKEGETYFCHYIPVQSLEYTGGLSYCSDGKHYWQVTVIRKLCEECPEEQKWQDLSKPSEERWIYYQPVDELDQPWEPPEPPKKPPPKP